MERHILFFLIYLAVLGFSCGMWFFFFFFNVGSLVKTKEHLAGTSELLVVCGI